VQVKEVLPRAKATMPTELRRPLLARAKKYAEDLDKEDQERKVARENEERESKKKEHERQKRGDPAPAPATTAPLAASAALAP
jgi:hypothetical protein